MKACLAFPPIVTGFCYRVFNGTPPPSPPTNRPHGTRTRRIGRPKKMWSRGVVGLFVEGALLTDVCSFFLLFGVQKALKAQSTEMPEPTQWDNDLASGKACELTDHLDDVPCTESENSDSD